MALNVANKDFRSDTKQSQDPFPIWCSHLNSGQFSWDTRLVSKWAGRVADRWLRREWDSNFNITCNAQYEFLLNNISLKITSISFCCISFYFIFQSKQNLLAGDRGKETGDRGQGDDLKDQIFWWEKNKFIK